MPIAQRVRSFLQLFLFALLAVVTTAQKKEAVEIRYISPERYERATTTDDKGLVQWAEHKQEKCQTCNGSTKTKCSTCDRFSEEAKFCIECKLNKERETACRSCCGVGYWPDPLEKAHCPECMGAGFALCLLCGGGGRIKVDSGGDRWTKCTMCSGEGGWKCAVCSGARLVETAALKPSLKDANAATLTKAIATTEQLLKDLAAFTPSAKNTRKEVKELVKIYGTGAAVYPPLKRIGKALEDVMSKVYGGNQYQGFEEREANTMAQFKANSEYFLKHQRRMLELAHKRAEANEKVLAESKGK